MAPASPPSSRFAANLARLRERLARVDREVAIVAVTKGRSVDQCREAAAAGLPLGENRVGEALAKLHALPAAEWHLIGHLQANKVGRAAGRFALIQSLDSERLAELIASRAPGQAVLVEVNVSREAAKHGVAPPAASELCASALRAGLDVRGLMCVGPLHSDPRPAFLELARLRDDAQQRLGRPLPLLSMGMTDDYEAALDCGSTMLRIGRALFA